MTEQEALTELAERIAKVDRLAAEAIEALQAKTGAVLDALQKRMAELETEQKQLGLDAEKSHQRHRAWAERTVGLDQRLKTLEAGARHRTPEGWEALAHDLSTVLHERVEALERDVSAQWPK